MIRKCFITEIYFWINFSNFHKSFMNNFTSKQTFIIHQISINIFIFQKQTVSIWTFTVVKSFCKIISKIWLWIRHKFSTVNKICFVRYSYNIFITLFINFLSFFFFTLGTEIFVLFGILCKAFKLLFESCC